MKKVYEKQLPSVRENESAFTYVLRLSYHINNLEKIVSRRCQPLRKKKRGSRPNKHNRGTRKLFIFWREQGKCFYCQKTLTLNLMNLDHLLPRAFTGTNLLNNIVGTCYPCNNKKGDMFVLDFVRQFYSKDYYRILKYICIVTHEELHSRFWNLFISQWNSLPEEQKKRHLTLIQAYFKSIYHRKKHFIDTDQWIIYYFDGSSLLFEIPHDKKRQSVKQKYYVRLNTEGGEEYNVG